MTFFPTAFIRRVHLDRLGYATRGEPIARGRYFGLGAPLFTVTIDDGTESRTTFERAASYADLRADYKRAGYRLG